MLRELFLDLKNLGHSVVSLQGGIVGNYGTSSITIGHDESGFSTYIQSGTVEAPEYSGNDGLDKSAVIQICQQYQASAVTVAA